MLIGVFTLVAAVVAVPLNSVRSSSLLKTRSAFPQARGDSRQINGSNSTVPEGWSPTFLPVPQPLAETITTFAADCITPRTNFFVGETVCAKTDSVTPLDGSWWVNWILLTDGATVVSGGDGVFPVTANPQTFTYAPTTPGPYKVSLSNVPGDPSQTPAGFTVVPAPTLATYASGCASAKTDFNLGETVCVKVSGLSNAEFPQRRVQIASPEGAVLRSFDITDNSQQFNYTLPAATTESLGNRTIDHRGTWEVAIVDLDAVSRQSRPMVVHKSNLFIDRVADLQVSKLLVPAPDPPAAGSNLTFQLFITNQGPDPATNPRLADVTLPNTTFVSFSRVSLLGSNMIPNPTFGSSFADNADTDFVRFVRDPGSSAFSSHTLSGASLLSFLSDSSLTFICISPSAGSAGTTTCTTVGELAPGETASFTAVYQVSGNVANGAELADTNSVSVSSDTVDQFPAGNSQPAVVNTSNPNPPACTITCPDNITVGTNTTDGQGHLGAIVSFGPEAAGSCGNGITSTPASGSFFAVGTTSVTSRTGSGASCNFNVTVVNTPQPTISCAADQSATAPSGQSEVAVAVPTPTFAGSFTQNQNPPRLTSARSDQRGVSDPYPIGTTTITWTVTDQYGTMRSCNQRVVVTSADAPTISCPSDKTFAAASGDCQTTLTAPQIGTPTVGGLNTTYDSLRSDHLALTDPFPAGQTAITWIATNALGNASCTQVITITTTGDTTPPVLTVPPDINISTSECSVLLDDELGIATATDNCTPAVTITRTGLPQISCPIPGNPTRTCDSFFFPTGTTNITYTATDAAGNTATGVQHINIAEDPVIFPTITAPNNLNVNTLPNETGCGTFIGDATLGSATASDNCPGVVVTRTGVPAGNIFPVGDTYITYTATDRTNHSSQAAQRVTVVDVTPPVINCPANITVHLPLNSTATSMAVNYPAATATDNCPGTISIGYSIASGSTFSVGTTSITVTATDAHNNSASCVFTVTVLYDFAGFFSPVGNLPILNAVNAGQAIPVKFSLSGNKGLSIFAADNPYTVSLNCSTSDPGVDITETVNAGSSSLGYSSGSDQYSYVWKTDGSWAGTCRKLVVTLNDGSVHVANFKFK